ncbi:MAG TPA: DUF2721 domain-containing protein [Gammaproteobacteria bacterium]|jgi:hypothetical protein|nr:DUF2721 domain-containing protein [Gammaproteobacteria bacterium]
MTETMAISAVANAIQLSVAPVFLLAGVGALLNVLTNRLNRAVDRYRFLNEHPELLTYKSARDEMQIQLRRTKLIQWAIILCTVCALAICLVVALLFGGSELMADPSAVIAVLFIGGMLSLTVGLVLFLREIALALRLMKLFSRISSDT